MSETKDLVQAQSTAVSESASIMQVIARAAADPKIDVAKMQALLEMQVKIAETQAKGAFNQAMRAAQSEMLPVVRDAQNRHTQSWYARLETVDEAIRPIITKHGFAMTYDSPEEAGVDVVVRCSVLHDGGYSRDYRLRGPSDVAGSQGKANKTAIQGIGSSVSYLRRYLACMIWNVVLKNEDRDGNSPGAPTGPLSDAQINTMTNMVNEIAMGPKRFESFLKFAAVNGGSVPASIQEIQASEYERVMIQLRQRLAEKRAGEG